MVVTKTIKNGFKNKNIRFIVFRYFIYAVQFGNSLFIAKNLGPFFLGEFGFITLTIQYLTQINFGIPNALNVKLSTFVGNNAALQNEYLGNSMLFTFIYSAFIITLAVAATFFDIPIFQKYDFYQYIYFVVFIGVLQNMDVLFIHVFRVKNSLKPITLYQSVMPLLNLLVCFFWKGKELLYALVFSQLFSYFLSFIVFIYYTPIKLKLRFKFTVQKELVKAGVSLMLYSASFYFIMIITRTFVSYFFSVKELGFFSFALSFAQASFLILDTITFLIFPKLVNRLKHDEKGEVFKKMEFVRSNYNLIAFLLIFSTILVFPLVLTFLPVYAASYKPFTLLSISLALLSGNFGISTLFISNGKESLLSRIALVACLLNFILVWLISSNSSTFYLLCFAPLATYIIYSCMLGYFYNLVFFKKANWRSIFSNFDVRLVLPAVLLAIAVMIDNISIQAVAYCCIIFFNWKRIKALAPVLRQLINNPSVFKI
jgi:O-antigen/teichoic acid export membrane protein